MTSRKRQWKRGYHLTPLRNIESIMMYGLQPYPIKKHGCTAIYTWQRKPSGVNLIGMAIQKLLDHQCWQVALLSFMYRECDCYRNSKDTWYIKHCGTFQGNEGNPWWYYHQDEPSILLLKPIFTVRLETIIDFEHMELTHCGKAQKEGTTERVSIPRRKILAEIEQRQEIATRFESAIASPT